MPIVYADRVQETTTSTGTGVVALGGAALGFRTFVVGVGVGNQSYYAITDDVTGDWEVGLGTLGVGTFSRDLVLSSSNANLLVSFVAGTKKIFTVSPATFFTGALSTADHGTTSHAGIPGVPPAEAFTAPVHASTSHATLPGVGNLATAPGAGLTDHATVNHAGLPGVPAAEVFTAPVHATTDHAGITGAGLTTKQSLIFPVSMLHQYWTPNARALASIGECFQPSNDSDDGFSFGPLTIDDDAGSDPVFAYTNVSGFGPSMQWFFNPGNQLRMETPAICTNHLPRLVIKVKRDGSILGGEAYFGLSTIAAQSGPSSGAVNAICAKQNGNIAWSIERQVTGITKTSTPTGVAGATAVVILFNYTATATVTVTFYDAVSFAVLFTTTFTGAAEVPAPSTLGRVRVWSGSANAGLINLNSMLLSFNE